MIMAGYSWAQEYNSHGSYALHFHEEKCHGHILKSQIPTRKGCGRYQGLLADERMDRDEHNLTFAKKE